jgi:hypothetical protein
MMLKRVPWGSYHLQREIALGKGGKDELSLARRKRESLIHPLLCTYVCIGVSPNKNSGITTQAIITQFNNDSCHNDS